MHHYPFALALLWLTGCAMKIDFYKEVDQFIGQRQYEMAAQKIQAQQKAYGSTSAVLYKVELGMLKHYGGQFDVSNTLLLAAEKEMEDLFTQSVSTHAASMLTNDNIIPYQGEDHERVLVNLVLALNYAQLGQLEDALVEARKVDGKLDEYSRVYEGQNTYKQDAFIRYLTGLLYEATGEFNDAFIAYKQAYEDYKVYQESYGTPCPRSLKSDILRMAHALGFEDDRARFEKEFGFSVSSGTKTGSIVAVIYSGQGPVKEEMKERVSVFDDKGTSHTFVIALPEFRSRGHEDSYAMTVEGNGQRFHASAENGEDITQIAAKALDDRLTLLYLKSGGRALLKFLASEKIKKEAKSESDDALTSAFKSILVDAAVDATERADVRTWRTLPNRIYIARLDVPPGTYSMTASGGSGSMPIASEAVSIEAGDIYIMTIPDIDPRVTQ